MQGWLSVRRAWMGVHGCGRKVVCGVSGGGGGRGWAGVGVAGALGVVELRRGAAVADRRRCTYAGRS